MTQLSVLSDDSAIAALDGLSIPAGYLDMVREHGPRAALDRWADDLAFWRDQAERRQYSHPFLESMDQRMAGQETVLRAAYADTRLADWEAEHDAAVDHAAVHAEAAVRAIEESRAAFGEQWQTHGFTAEGCCPVCRERRTDSDALMARILAAVPELAPEDRERAAIEAERRQAEAEDRRRRLAAGLDPLPDRTWLGHLLWLRLEFGDREFTTADVRVAAREGWTRPPERIDPAAHDFTLRLGQAYGKADGLLVDGWLWLAGGGVTANRRRWRVEAKEGPSTVDT